jgi:hypothetical protein
VHPTPSALSAIDTANVWINSERLNAERLRGRVVLVDFWTYSCVNWLRTLPYIRAGEERYRDRGLVVVDAPEFGFEHDVENVQRATRELGVGYPVVVDNEFTIWRSFENHYWPAVYLVDREGPPLSPFRRGGLRGDRARDPATARRRGSDCPRRHRRPLQGCRLGHTRIAGDLPGLGPQRAPRRPGCWPPGAQPLVAHGRVVGRQRGRRTRRGCGLGWYRFQARDLNLVLAPPAPVAAIRFSLRLDGQAPGDSHGLDIDAAGEGTVSEPRMYQLVRARAAVGERDFEITFLDPGVRAYVFTFG